LKSTIIILLIYLAILPSCEVDPRLPLPECPTLEELLLYVYGDSEDNDIGSGIEFITPDSGATFAAFNPINQNQLICYYSGYFTDYKSSLVTYDLNTKEFSSILIDPQLFSLPEISSNGWLLLTLSDSQLWKVKTDGDSLTQLTSGGLNANFTWSPNAEQFIYSTTLLTGIFQTLIADKNGTTVHTFPEHFIAKKPTWSADGNFIAYVEENSMDISIVYTDSWEIENIIKTSGEYDDNETVLDIEIYPDSKYIIWTTETELRKTDISTGHTEILSSTCDSKSYSIFDISADGAFIITRRVFYEMFGDNVMLSSKFFLCDVNGAIQNEFFF
jgi:hypothetical protein